MDTKIICDSFAVSKQSHVLNEGRRQSKICQRLSLLVITLSREQWTVKGKPIIPTYFACVKFKSSVHWSSSVCRGKASYSLHYDRALEASPEKRGTNLRPISDSEAGGWVVTVSLSVVSVSGQYSAGTGTDAEHSTRICRLACLRSATATLRATPVQARPMPMIHSEMHVALPRITRPQARLIVVFPLPTLCTLHAALCNLLSCEHPQLPAIWQNPWSCARIRSPATTLFIVLTSWQHYHFPPIIQNPWEEAEEGLDYKSQELNSSWMKSFM